MAIGESFEFWRRIVNPRPIADPRIGVRNYQVQGKLGLRGDEQ